MKQHTIDSITVEMTGFEAITLVCALDLYIKHRESYELYKPGDEELAKATYGNDVDLKTANAKAQEKEVRRLYRMRDFLFNAYQEYPFKD